ncbi:ATP-binding cassette domain-containing protein [Georgenia satyanarayanai]|uniref:methionine ABC transporter ATP-binding protein n=1 Tax=Georgenia satyanarayanai TaxID=860221 RepID=UPI0020424886|nr:ATP-binding cassette domain-containing protein [Georgenia satyanarayanai]MCM3659428.1 ATP-binding cassette domain-containing protein [Georgenia satyanarayanai]
MITLDGVSKRYVTKNGTVDALVDVSLDVDQGDVYGIIGFSGAGKSTLLRMVNQLETPDAGTVNVNGQDLTAMSSRELRRQRRDIGMVFQQFNLLETKTVYRNVAMPLLIQGASKAEIDRRVDEVLKIVELEDKRNASIRQLSGGQKQRVGIARALTTQPSILLCDEATSALDPKTTESILALLKKINREMGVTILLITHQMHVIQRICTKVAVMEAGRIVERGNVLDVFTRPRESITQDFVRTVVNDQIPEPLLEMVQAETRPQELLRLRFVGDTVRQPLLASLSRIEGLEVNILGATVEELQESVLCLFLVQLIGGPEPVRRAELLLDDAGILRERIAA